jgi:hypothetical protein
MDEEKEKFHQACDFCRKRKIRCNGDKNTPCSGCITKKIPCTFTCPVKKRGPQPSI